MLCRCGAHTSVGEGGVQAQGKRAWVVTGNGGAEQLGVPGKDLGQHWPKHCGVFVALMAKAKSVGSGRGREVMM